MATATQLRFDDSVKPVFAVPGLTADAGARTAELLQKNHDDYHIFFNDEGLHNHMAHHLPSIYALGADATIIQKQYDANESTQQPHKELHEDVVRDMTDPAVFKKYLGRNNLYRDYLVFFQNEIESKGWENVLNEYLFARNELADDMLGRLFGGLYHPLIHLSFGIEFTQPAIIAEGLAETAVHAADLGPFLVKCEQHAARSSSSEEAATNAKSLTSILSAVRSDPTLRDTITEKDSGSKIRVVIKRQTERLVPLLASYRATEATLREQLKSMYAACALMTFATQRTEKAQKIDFFHMHSMNAALFFVRLLDPEESKWLSVENKIRLLEWKGRLDVVNYIARASPELLVEEVKEHVGMDAQGNEEEQWQKVFRKSCEKDGDDGHLPKLVRACAVGNELWKEGESKKQSGSANGGYGALGDADPLASAITKDSWLRLAHMSVDSTDVGGSFWIRSCGLDSAWKDVPGRERKVASAL